MLFVTHCLDCLSKQTSVLILIDVRRNNQQSIPSSQMSHGCQTELLVLNRNHKDSLMYSFLDIPSVVRFWCCRQHHALESPSNHPRIQSFVLTHARRHSKWMDVQKILCCVANTHLRSNPSTRSHEAAIASIARCRVVERCARLSPTDYSSDRSQHERFLETVH